jgi:hypothetical protein
MPGTKQHLGSLFGRGDPGREGEAAGVGFLGMRRWLRDAFLACVSGVSFLRMFDIRGIGWTGKFQLRCSITNHDYFELLALVRYGLACR